MEKESTHKAYTNGRVFIVRPFNVKTNRKGEEIDFDKVDDELISPCIEALGLSGGTTGEFVQQGNIREDMFRELLAADLVIADIAIHNANVFYELGIRHALRDRCTILIKANQHNDPGIFDLSTDRYMPYDLENPADSRDKLIEVITATLQSENKDSPVFKLLPGLTNTDPDNVVIVPLRYREKIKRCKKAAKEDTDQAKSDLVKIRTEIIGKHWEKQGLRLIGNAQFKLSDYAEAITTWKLIRQYNPYDIEANQCLATCFQKTKQYILSEQAAERALTKEGDWDRAETYALIGSNIKTRWRLIWEEKKDLQDRQIHALRSPLLEQSYKAYSKGFQQHRSHYYSGLNAVAMLTLQVQLAHLHPNVWSLDYNSDLEAKLELEKKQTLLNKMISASDLAIETSIENYNDDWARISKADLMLLTGKTPERVEHEYSKWLNTVSHFTNKSLSNQLQLYKNLGLFSATIEHLDEILRTRQEAN